MTTETTQSADYDTAKLRSGNPFATRWVRPGAVPYVFPQGDDAAGLMEQLRQAGWRGAIVGPHGSGKSTLLTTLIPQFQQTGVHMELVALHDGQRKLPGDVFAGLSDRHTSKFSSELPQAMIVVDGSEQLSWLARWRLLAACRRHGWGLLVTAHAAPAGLPVLFRTATELDTVQHLVDHLLPSHGDLIRPDDVAAAFHTQAGNVRETLFALYDLFEQRRLTAN